MVFSLKYTLNPLNHYNNNDIIPKISTLHHTLFYHFKTVFFSRGSCHGIGDKNVFGFSVWLALCWQRAPKSSHNEFIKTHGGFFSSHSFFISFGSWLAHLEQKTFCHSGKTAGAINDGWIPLSGFTLSRSVHWLIVTAKQKGAHFSAICSFYAVTADTSQNVWRRKLVGPSADYEPHRVGGGGGRS